MRVLVCGSRYPSQAMKDKVLEVVEWVARKGYSLILGGAIGIDSLAEASASKLSVPMEIIRGFPGGYLSRDRVMVSKADLVIAIWDGQSRGTKYTYEYARKVGKHVVLREFKQE